MTHPLVKTPIASTLRTGFFAFFPSALVAGGLALAPLLGVAGLASLRPAVLAQWGRAPAGVWLLAAFSAWAAASAFWSSYPDHGQALRFAATLIPCLLFAADRDGNLVTEAAGLAALVVALAMLSFEAFAGMPLNRAVQPEALEWVLARNPGRGVSVIAVTLWPVLAALFARGGLIRTSGALLLGGVGALLSTRFGMDANLMAYAAGGLAFAIGCAAPRLGIWLTSFCLAAWLLAAPFATPFVMSALNGGLPHSWSVREEIWRFAIARIWENPWVGHGMDASRAFTETITVGDETMRALPLHPHSASLQIWLETGAVGALLAAAALAAGGFALTNVFGGRRAHAGAICATFAAAGVLSNVSFGAWQEWWIAAICAGAALIAAIPVTSARA